MARSTNVYVLLSYSAWTCVTSFDILSGCSHHKETAGRAYAHTIIPAASLTPTITLTQTIVTLMPCSISEQRCTRSSLCFMSSREATPIRFANAALSGTMATITNSPAANANDTWLAHQRMIGKCGVTVGGVTVVNWRALVADGRWYGNFFRR